ncbi:tetratricopeptide repeat protein [Mesorhizobium sp.]|uniref:tetratricopeptide repeat protein n=1 Tax=Mesorhizobium sp. TaxID=1871066 RepID=UPI0026005B11|nr:tetratricopeptide repeat protein [Mesorhizobium sp.]
MPQDRGEAKWFRLAADQGVAASQYELGVIYGMGEGAPQDAGESAKWLRLAADQGHVMAQYYLGAMYEDGLGVPRDNVQALKWLRLVAAALSRIVCGASRQGVQTWERSRCEDDA